MNNLSEQSEYGRVIQPLLVTRPLDHLIFSMRAAVWKADGKFPGASTVESVRERILQKSAGQTCDFNRRPLWT